ncbi:ROK family transcriptional regulator [Gracilibacillus alcaliphilus]|uniref:ROK family transcriptional regulator n=1 Tax=Gracilibacillus alcaliphilus TaxID=1401441 RepID=UPI00195B0870|nr:ROK family transcriptional regulator [Gracilibacillus alcaliphilus]MBM7677678.1 putative NBD/HSP70 family sugar kinase [Gracilibacillus alcaliphilus]
MLKDFLQQTSSKYHGMKLVYQYVYQHGPVTKTELVEKTGVKQTTVTRHLDYLLQNRLIKISEYQESSGGRPPALYQIVPDTGYIIGVDLSRMVSTIVLVNATLEEIDSFTFTMTEDHTPEKTLAIINHTMEQFLTTHHISRDQLLGIGIGAVGPLNRKKGMIMDTKGFMAPGWRQFSIMDHLPSFQSEKILLENGANVATLQAYMQQLQQEESILYCISGRGLRCGVLAEGRLLKNKTGDVSSFGEMIVDIERRQTLSSLITYDYLLQEVNRRYLEEKETPFYPEAFTKNTLMQTFFNQLQQKDSIVQEVVLRSAEVYGVGLANIINVLQPNQIILNSELVRKYPPYYDKIVETAKLYIDRKERVPIQFKQEKQKEKVIARGAATMIWQSYFS